MQPLLHWLLHWLLGSKQEAGDKTPNSLYLFTTFCTFTQDWGACAPRHALLAEPEFCPHWLYGAINLSQVDYPIVPKTEFACK
jgi:hypothetical protein